MGSQIGRRRFLAVLGGAAASPLAARAQQGGRPVIGLLNGVSFEGAFAPYVEEIRLGLKETGFIEGQNVAIEYRTADGHPERLPELAADLVRRRVAVIIAIGGTRTAFAARDATSTIPIVFANGGDAVESGLVKSLNRPEANLTGISFTTSQLAPKRLELLCELAPRARLIGFLDNTVNPSEAVRRDLVEKAQSIGRQILVFLAGSEPQIDLAFVGMAEQHVAGLVVSPDAYLNTRRDQIIALALRNAIPMIVPWGRDVVAQGALMSYATLLGEIFRPAGVYAGRILKGAKPADLPVLLPTRFELAINRRTAKALGLAIPQTLLVAADVVID
jgi:putative tryptophan/tyrosine transport system substrate-binding protein